jgi:hypothetical protein
LRYLDGSFADEYKMIKFLDSWAYLFVLNA